MSPCDSIRHNHFECSSRRFPCKTLMDRVMYVHTMVQRNVYIRHHKRYKIWDSVKRRNPRQTRQKRSIRTMLYVAQVLQTLVVLVTTLESLRELERLRRRRKQTASFLVEIDCRTRHIVPHCAILLLEARLALVLDAIDDGGDDKQIAYDQRERSLQFRGIRKRGQ